MNRIYYLFFLLAFFACKKKEKETPEETISPYIDHVAPCDLDYEMYDYDSVFFSASPNFPNAQFRIKFGYNNGVYTEFGFEKIPTTGIYYMNEELNSSLNIDQIAFKQFQGALGVKSLPNEPAACYVEMNNDYMIISFCNQMVMLTDPDTWTSQLGFATFSRKIKKKF